MVSKSKLLNFVEPRSELKPEFDLAAIYAERFRIMRPNVGDDEARARAYDHAVRACEAHYGVDLEEAKRRVLTALGRR
jgi:hypothetical protein